jgi:hypothetical protein
VTFQFLTATSCTVGDNNCECLCLSCERTGQRGFSRTNSLGESRSGSPSPTATTNVREENSPEVVPTSPFSSVTLNASPVHHSPRELNRRSSRLSNRRAISSSSPRPIPWEHTPQLGGTSAVDIPEYCNSTDPCMTCGMQSVSTPDARYCARFAVPSLRAES